MRPLAKWTLLVVVMMGMAWLLVRTYVPAPAPPPSPQKEAKSESVSLVPGNPAGPAGTAGEAPIRDDVQK